MIIEIFFVILVVFCILKYISLNYSYFTLILIISLISSVLPLMLFDFNLKLSIVSFLACFTFLYLKKDR